MTQIVHEIKAMRRFFLSYTLHLTSVFFIPFLIAIVLIAVGYYYTTRFFAAAVILDLFGEDPTLEYVLSFLFAIVTLIFAVYLLSVTVGAFHYAKNMFLPLKREFFGEQASHGQSPSAQRASYPPKPTSPPPPTNVASPLTTAYAESSDRARWGPR